MGLNVRIKKSARNGEKSRKINGLAAYIFLNVVINEWA